jgi:hypothetical protein
MFCFFFVSTKIFFLQEYMTVAYDLQLPGVRVNVRYTFIKYHILSAAQFLHIYFRA